MSELVYYNGILMSEREVAIPLTDRSYLYGEGLFETMKATRGFIPFLQEHFDRLIQGVEKFKFPLSISPAMIEFAVYQTLFHNRLKEAYIRLTLSRESKEIGDLTPGDKTNLLIVVKPLKKTSLEVLQPGCSVGLSEEFCITPDSFSQFKSTNYLRYLKAAQWAQENSFEEALLKNAHGNLVEASRANLFIHDGETWVTPGLDEGVIPGVTRRVLLALMKENQIPCEVRPVKPEEFATAQQAFLCNALKNIQPIQRVDQRLLYQGEVKAETQGLARLFQEEIQLRFEKFESKHWGAKSAR